MFNTIYHTVPTAAPASIEAHQLNSTSVLLSRRPPLAQYQNGIIRGYYVELNSESSSEAEFQYTTQDQYLLVDNLQPYSLYGSRVAAYTVGRGPLSEPFNDCPKQ